MGQAITVVEEEEGSREYCDVSSSCDEFLAVLTVTHEPKKENASFTDEA